MALQVVGAGLCRTGTQSLKTALERLLGGRCSHMWKVIGEPVAVGGLQDYAEGGSPDWDAVFDGYVAATDIVSSIPWRSLAAHWPDATVLLSTHLSSDRWWRSMAKTVSPGLRDAEKAEPRGEHAGRMAADLLRNHFCDDLQDRRRMIAAYEAHNAAVRAEVSSGRLIDWRVDDGWEPLCAGLGLPVPDEPFPHLNSTADFLRATGQLAGDEGQAAR